MAVSVTDIITIFGSIVTGLIGAGAWWNSEKSNRLEEAVHKERRAAKEQQATADLQKAEIAGWQTLIETTRNQYQVMVEQAASLQQKLNEALETIRIMTEEADKMRDRIDELTQQLAKGDR